MKTSLIISLVLSTTIAMGGWCEKHSGNSRMYCFTCFNSNNKADNFDDLPNRFKGDSLERLIDVVFMCESHTCEWEDMYVNTVGDNGKAIGIAQMWETQVDECNRIARKMHKTDRTVWSYEDRNNVVLTRAMVRIFLQHRALTWYQQTGEYPTNDRLVATWHRPTIGKQKEWYMAKARKCIYLRSKGIKVLDKFDREPWAYTYEKNGKTYKDYR